jgi:hypothetical protein
LHHFVFSKTQQLYSSSSFIKIKQNVELKHRKKRERERKKKEELVCFDGLEGLLL